MHETGNLCEACDKSKIMYYREYCPRCEEPRIKTMDYYNLLECLYYIEATGHPGFKAKFWEMLIDLTSFTNESTVELWNDIDGSNPLLKELFDKMGIKDTTMTFEISW